MRPTDPAHGGVEAAPVPRDSPWPPFLLALARRGRLALPLSLLQLVDLVVQLARAALAQRRPEHGLAEAALHVHDVLPFRGAPGLVRDLPLVHHAVLRRHLVRRVAQVHGAVVRVGVAVLGGAEVGPALAQDVPHLLERAVATRARAGHRHLVLQLRALSAQVGEMHPRIPRPGPENAAEVRVVDLQAAQVGGRTDGAPATKAELLSVLPLRSCGKECWIPDVAIQFAG